MSQEEKCLICGAMVTEEMKQEPLCPSSSLTVNTDPGSRTYHFTQSDVGALKSSGAILSTTDPAHNPMLTIEGAELVVGLISNERAIGSNVGTTGTVQLTPMRYPTSDPKYVIIENQLCNAASLEPIPLDEPIFIFRSRDYHAIAVLNRYLALLQQVAHRHENLEKGEQHQNAVMQRIVDFSEFRKNNPGRMKIPDTDLPS